MNQTDTDAKRVNGSVKSGTRRRRRVPHESRWKTGTVGEAYGKMNEMRRGREAEEQKWDRRG